MSEDKEARWAEDVIDFTYMSAMSPRIIDFPSSDKTTADVREKHTKSLYLQGLGYITVRILSQFLLKCCFIVLFSCRVI